MALVTPNIFLLYGGQGAKGGVKKRGAIYFFLYITCFVGGDDNVLNLIWKNRRISLI